METHHWAVPRAIWVGLTAVTVYVAVVLGLGDLLDNLSDDTILSLILGQWVPVALLIALGVIFTWKAGWARDTWASPSVFTERRRWWMLAIPVALVLQIIVIFVGVPWAERSLLFVAVVLIASLLIGLGEELYFRGIFRTSILGHHGELVALLITSLVFGIAHAFKFLVVGVPVEAIALNVGFLAMDGALFYGCLRATGTLWVPILLHGLGDFARFAQQGTGDTIDTGVTGGSGENGIIDFLTAGVEYLLIGLSIALVVSVARNDRRVRAAVKTSAAQEPAADRSVT